MDIIQRNFMRLLRSGAFGKHEELEPMSEWKWQQLYQISMIHGVTPWIADGIRQLSDDFFLQLSPTLRQQFEDDTTERYEDYKQQQLTNPRLNHILAMLIEEEGGTPTLNLLLNIIGIARYILTQGASLRHMIMLGTYLRTTRDHIDYTLLKSWIKKLDMERIAQLEGSLMIELFHFEPQDIPFTEAESNKSTRRVVQDIFKLTQKNAAEWYFTQGKSVFVRTNDSDAMMWHVKLSAKYLRYYPREAVTNFMANFAHSLSHIEE